MLIDAHNHLDFYKDKLPSALLEIKNNNIITLGCAMDLKSYLFTRELSKKNSYIIPCFGIHPWKVYENHKNLDIFDYYIKEAMILGEIGLDYHWVLEKEKYPYMLNVFEYFLKKAKEYDKLTNIHTKGAENQIYSSIKKYNIRTPIIHWYSGPLDILKKLLDYGCYFTIGVDIVTSNLTKEIVKILPLNRILTETDGPLALEWVNHKYGYPMEIINIVKQISLIKSRPVDEIRLKIYSNFKELLKSDFDERR